MSQRFRWKESAGVQLGQARNVGPMLAGLPNPVDLLICDSLRAKAPTNSQSLELDQHAETEHFYNRAASRQGPRLIRIKPSIL